VSMEMSYNGCVAIVNKKARRDYEVLEKWEAGIVLTGAEVKSVRKGAVSLAGARAVIMAPEASGEEVWVVRMQISPYEFSGDEEYDPVRRRKLLLSRKEIGEIAGKVRQKGLTLVPLRCYNRAGLIKVELALVRGKKKYEKREDLRKRAEAREIEQAYKRRGRK